MRATRPANPRVIVTRPAAQAVVWVHDLRGAGIDAVALPLIDIAPPADLEAVDQAWRTLADCAMVYFVSPSAVQHFFALAPRGSGWPAGVIAAAPGPGTAAALRAQGVPADRLRTPPPDAPSFDSEALWSVVGGLQWTGRRVLVVRGEDGRDWLADKLREHGAQVDYLAAYARRVPAPSGAGRALLAVAAAAPQRHLWLFSSSEAVRNLATLAADVAGPAAQALATHERIADAARRAGFGHVQTCGATLAAVRAAIEGWSIESIAP